MKSIVHHILTMTTVVACLSCLLGHVVADEGKPAAEEKQPQKEARVVVIKAQPGEDAAALLGKVHQLKGDIPKELHEKIQQKLAEALKSAAPGKGGAEGKVEARVIVVSEDGKTYGLAEKGDAQPHKAVAIAVAVDDKAKDQDVSVKHEAKQYSVKVEDGKVFLNGKPVAQWKDGQHVLIDVDGKDGSDKHTSHGKVLFMGKDGKPIQLNMELRIDGEHVKGLSLDKPAGKVLIRRVESKDAGESKVEEKVRQFKVQARQVQPGQPLKIMAAPVQARIAHGDVNARLKNIEAELKKIRTLLQKLQEDDDDDEGHDAAHEDDDHDDDHDDHDHGDHDHDDGDA